MAAIFSLCLSDMSSFCVVAAKVGNQLLHLVRFALESDFHRSDDFFVFINIDSFVKSITGGVFAYEIPSFFLRELTVVRFMPSISAAPPGPPIRPPVFLNT